MDNTQALKEGWGLFQSDGKLEIQRLDDPEGCEPKFDGDDAALAFVREKAKTSEYHGRALALLEEKL